MSHSNELIDQGSSHSQLDYFTLKLINFWCIHMYGRLTIKYSVAVVERMRSVWMDVLGSHSVSKQMKIARNGRTARFSALSRANSRSIKK